MNRPYIECQKECAANQVQLGSEIHFHNNLSSDLTSHSQGQGSRALSDFADPGGRQTSPADRVTQFKIISEISDWEYELQEIS